MAQTPSTSTQTSSSTSQEQHELEHHVLYAMLRPVVRLAHRLTVPLKELGQWTEMGYFHELRRQNMKMREISEALEISMRKAASLSRQLKDGFFEPARHGLARRLEFMIWAEPMSLVRMQQSIAEEDPEDVASALERLVVEGRVTAVEGDRIVTYHVASAESRLVRGDWVAKLDALNQLLDTVSSAVARRFFDDDPVALVRNLELRVRREDLGKLRKLYEEVIFKELAALDDHARGDPDSLAVDFAVCWAPRDEGDDG